MRTLIKRKAFVLSASRRSKRHASFVVIREEGSIDLDTFLQDVATRCFTVSAMAFQDVENLDLERLKGCCISVISTDDMLVPFCAYNLTSREGGKIYR